MSSVLSIRDRYRGDWYTKFSRPRLISALKQAGIAHPFSEQAIWPEAVSDDGLMFRYPEPDALTIALLDSFSEHDFVFASALSLTSEVPVWHWIDYHNFDTQYLDPFYTASSFDAALASVWSMLEEHRILVDDLSFEDGSLTLELRPSGRIVIRPIHFHSVDPKGISQVARALRNLRVKGDAEHVTKRLARIPGLSNLQPSSAASLFARPEGEAIARSAHQLTHTLRTMLSELGVDVPLHQAQELSARMFGAEDWQHFLSGESRLECKLSPTAITIEGKNLAPLFFASEEAAIWHYGQMRRAMGMEAVECEWSHLMDDMYLTTTMHEGTDDDECASCFTPPLADTDNEISLLSKPPSGWNTGTLSELFELGSSITQRVAASNSRKGIDGASSFWLGRLLFSIPPVQSEGSYPYWRIEEFDQEMVLVRSVQAAVHRSSIEYLPGSTSAYGIFDEYGSEVAFDLTGFEPGEIDKIVKLFDIPLDRRLSV